MASPEIDEPIVLSFTIPAEKKRPDYRNIAYVKNLMNSAYNDSDTILSTSMDILAVYMKGQKILYTESKVFCEQQLNLLMLPAIFISALCTVLSIGLKEVAAGVYVVSGFTAVNSFILSIISYLKLDAKAEAHKTSAYQFDKLQTLCEFSSGKILFFRDKSESEDIMKTRILEIINDIENKVKEIKDTNKFIVPESIRFHYKQLYDQNIFADVKEVQIQEMVLQTELKKDLNEIIRLERLSEDPDNDESVNHARTKKDLQIIKLIEHRKNFLEIDKKVKTEVEKHIIWSKKRWCQCLNWMKT